MRPQSLTPEQEAVVQTPDGPHLVVAPPGAGKTEVLIRRALWLVQRSTGEPFRILAITYTEKAAAELAARAREALGEEAWRVQASTLHAFCLDMLQHYGAAVGVTSGVTILDEDKLRRAQLAEALAGLGHTLTGDELDHVLQELDRFREQLVLPELTPSRPIGNGTLTLQDAYLAYEESLDDNHVLDFPGLLYRGWRLLEEDEWVTFHYRRQYRHLLLDEAQDLTETHVSILRTLCRQELRNVFIVADDDQEIYSFAGASSKHYTEFAKDLGAEVHRLRISFRSATRIIEAAERLRAHLHTLNVAHGTIKGATTAPGWIGVRSFPDPVAEGRGVAEWVRGLLQDGLLPDWVAEGEERSIRAEDICVMARTRFGFDPLLAALQASGVEAVLRTEEAGLFDSPAGRAVYLSLRLLANPRDRASRQRLEELLQDRETDTAAEATPAYAPANSHVRLDAVLERLELPDELRAVIRADAGDEIPWGELERIQVPSTDPTDGQHRERELWEADIARLTAFWDRYAALSTKPDRKLTTFLREISRAQRTPPDAPGVRLLTPYRAKGLQFRAIAVLGMVEGSFPHYRVRTDREIDFERRAVYVAMTRATRAVLLTYAERRQDRWGRTHRDRPSRFLREAGLL